MRNKLKSGKIKIIGILFLSLLIILLWSIILTEIDDLFSWIEDLYYVKILLIGIAFIKGKDLWKPKVNKIEEGDNIIYKPKVWNKVVTILAGIAITIYLILDIDNQDQSYLSYMLNFIFIVVFLFLSVFYYTFTFLKNRNNYLSFNTSEINFKIQDRIKTFRYLDIKSVIKTDVIKLVLKDGNNYTLDNSYYIGNQDQLYDLIKSNLPILEKNEIYTINQSPHLNKSSECLTNDFLICVNYPQIQIEIDLVAFALNKDQKIISDEHFIFYNNLHSPEYSIENMCDQNINDSDESIKIESLKLPNSCTSIKIFAVKYSNQYEEYNLDFAENIQVRIYDLKDNARIIDYIIPFNLDKGNSIELLILFKDNNGWNIKPSGKQTEQDLQALVEMYC